MDQWIFNYEDLVELTGLKHNTIYQHRARGNFDPDDIWSVMLWLARHARPELRNQLVMHAIAREKTEIGEMKSSAKRKTRAARSKTKAEKKNKPE